MRKRSEANGFGSRHEADLVHELYECLLGQRRKSEILASLTREFEATYSVFLTRDKTTDTITITATDTLSTERQRAYQDYYARLLPVSYFRNRCFSVGKVLNDALYDDHRAYLRSELYNDFFRPLNADHLMFFATYSDHTTDEALVIRRGRQVGMFDSADVRKLRRIGRHLLNSQRLSRKISATEQNAKNLSIALETLGLAIFVTDQTARILHMTSAGEHLLRAGGIFKNVGQRLVARHTDLADELQEAIRRCATCVDHPEEQQPWSFLQVPVEDTGKSVATIQISAISWHAITGNCVPATLIIITDRKCERADLLRKLTLCFGLTPAESNLAAALCEGTSVSRYAIARGISVHTARTLLKRALGKTDTHSQAELVSLILRGETLL